jgi:hypothetical protein
MSDILDLAQFEKDFAAGKYNHLVASLKGGKAKKQQEAAKFSKVKAERKAAEKLPPVVKPVELPEPVGKVKNELLVCCESCGYEHSFIIGLKVKLQHKVREGSRVSFQTLDAVWIKEIAEKQLVLPTETLSSTITVEQCENCITDKDEDFS